MDVSDLAVAPLKPHYVARLRIGAVFEDRDHLPTLEPIATPNAACRRSGGSQPGPTDLGEVSLQPGTGGVFVITYNGEVIWVRKTDGGFPDVKQRVRDHLDPDRDLGHLDRLPINQGDRTP